MKATTWTKAAHSTPDSPDYGEEDPVQIGVSWHTGSLDKIGAGLPPAAGFMKMLGKDAFAILDGLIYAFHQEIENGELKLDDRMKVSTFLDIIERTKKNVVEQFAMRN